MDPVTLTATCESAEKWRANAKAERPDQVRINEADCPLCDLFRVEYKGCAGCPIREKTDRNWCGGTPYGNARDAFGNWLDNPTDPALRAEFHRRATDMADFLDTIIEDACRAEGDRLIREARACT